MEIDDPAHVSAEGQGRGHVLPRAGGPAVGRRLPELPVEVGGDDAYLVGGPEESDNGPVEGIHSAARVDDLHDALVHGIRLCIGPAQVHVEGFEATHLNPCLEADQLSERPEGRDARGLRSRHPSADEHDQTAVPMGIEKGLWYFKPAKEHRGDFAGWESPRGADSESLAEYLGRGPRH